MALPTKVNIGTAPGNGTGDPARTAFDKLNKRDEYLDQNKADKSELSALETTVSEKETPAGAQAKADQAEANANAYTDSLAQGHKWKTPVDLSTTENVALSGEQTIDGVVTSGSRVLVKDQTDATENGIYTTASGAWVRTTDADESTELIKATTRVVQGTQAGKIFTCNSEAITLGTTDIVFVSTGDATDHNSTLGIQGGTTSERYHLTLAQLEKLNGLEEGATADMTGAEIKALYEAQPNTNALTDTRRDKIDNLPDSIEPAFSKNTAFNKNFGTVAGTVAEGNDARINNGQTAYSWGNHAEAGYQANIPYTPANDSEVVKQISVNGGTPNSPVNGLVDLTVEGGGVSSLGIKNINIGTVNALHPTTPLTIPTYDGTGQSTHPSVIYFPDGFNGWKYWMAHTPYPNGDTTKENPSISVSNDRKTWQDPQGIVNPVAPAPTSGYNADPCLIQGYDGKLYVFYCQFLNVTNGFNSKLFVVSSSDGVTWSAPTLLIEKTEGTEFVSPSVIMEDNVYKMYLIVNGSPRTLERIESASPTSGWSLTSSTVCTVSNIPTDGGSIWHLEVKKYYEEYHIFLCNSTQGNSDATKIYFGSSPDGLNFNCAQKSLLDLESTDYISNRIYKGTGVLLNDHKYAFWYGVTGGSGGNTWRIAYTEVNLDDRIVITTNSRYSINTNTINPNILYATENKIYRGTSEMMGGSGGGTTGEAYSLNIAYDGLSKNVAAEDGLPIGLYVKNDGSELFVLGYNSKKVFKYTFGTPYDVSTLTLLNSYTFTQDTKPTDITFSADGLKMYIYGNNVFKIFQFNLSTAWDITTATYHGESVSSWNSALGIAISGDGSIMFVLSSATKKMNPYSLSTPYDITTGTKGTSVDVPGLGTGQGIWFSDDGLSLFAVDSSDSTVKKYLLTDPYVLTGMTQSAEILDILPEQGASPRAFVFANDGLIGYAVGDTNDVITSYKKL